MKLTHAIIGLSTFLMSCGAPVVHTEHPLTSIQQYLVTNGTESALIIDAPDGFDVVARTQTPVFMGATSLWTFSTPLVPRPEADCGCFMQAFNDGLTPPSNCTRNLDKPHAVLTRLDDNHTLEPFTEPSSPDSESTTTYQLNGMIGSSLLVTMCTSAYACGAAHPSSSCQLAAIDLDTAKHQSIEAFDLKPNLVEARADLRALDTAIEPDTQLTISSVRRSVVGTAAQVQALVTAPACYACSDNEWGSYSVSVWKKAGPNEELPGPVAAYFLAHPGANIWTPVDASNRNKIEAAFAR